MRHKKLTDSDIEIGMVYITPVNGILARVVVMGPDTLYRDGKEPRNAWQVRRVDLPYPLQKPRLASSLRKHWPQQGMIARKRSTKVLIVKGTRIY